MRTELSESPKRALGALGALAERLEIEPKRMAAVLKATAFKACKNDEQFAALIIVANTYGLNPLLKELYAFPGKGGEIVPVVSVDGWLRVINDHIQMDGMSDAWAEDGSWCEVTIHRKDRKHPTVHREYFDEVKRSTEPWKQHPRRMLKWKTIIQAGRIAFGFGGIHDEDEGQAVGMRDVTTKNKAVARDEPLTPGKTIELEPNPTTAEPEGRQKKKRHTRDCVIDDISEKATSEGKPFWVVSLDIGQKKVAMTTFSSTLAERVEGEIGAKVTATFTVGAKGLYSFEDFEIIGEVEGSLI